MNELKLAVALAKQVEKAIRPHVGRPGAEVVVNQGYADETFAIDEIAETVVENFCKKRKIAFITEDRGRIHFPSKYLFLVDPIDGTRNAMKGLPHYGCSIAIARNRAGATLEDVYAAVIREMDANRTFTAIKGRGAWLNRTKLKNKKKPVETPVIAIGGQIGSNYAALAPLGKMIASQYPKAIFKIYGSTALELCYVAEGKFDAAIDLRAKLDQKGLAPGLHDVAAAFLIIQEAGCWLATNSSAPLDPKFKIDFCASSDELLFRQLVAMMKLLT